MADGEEAADVGSGADEAGRHLEQDLQRWVAAAIITPEQAEAIRRLEAERMHLEPPPSRIPLVAEALGFLGGALAVIAGVFATSRFWHQLSTATRLALVGVVAVLLVAAGRLVRRQGQPALAHLGSFLWVLATGCTAFWAGTVAADVLHWKEADLACAVGIASSVVAAALWAWRPAPLQHATTLVALAVTVAGVASQVGHEGGPLVGLGLWALGVVWAVLAWRRVVTPTWLGYAAGGAVTIVAGRILGDAGVWADALSILSALAFLGASVPTRSTVLLWVGIIGVFVSVPITITRHFGASLGTPVALFLAGFSLVAVAVVASRVGLRIRAGPPGRFPLLRERPDAAITGSIAFVRAVGDRECVYVVAASGRGGERRLLCGHDIAGGPGALSWNDAGHIVAQERGPAGPRFVEIDPTTGSVVARGPSGDLRAMPPAGRARRSSDATSVDVGESAPGRARLTLRSPSGTSRTVFRVEGPNGYRFDDAIWSPDGRYVAVVDSEHRLLIVDVASPSPSPRVLVADATSPAWSPWQVPA